GLMEGNMLEIPESTTMARQIGETLTGRRIESAQANASPHKFAFYLGDPEGYGPLLSGRVVTGAKAHGGLVEVALDGAVLLFGDGANLRYIEPGQALPAKHQLLLSFDDGSALACSVQMYGGVWAFAEGQFDNPYYDVARAKPSPLTDAFDAAYFDGIVSAAPANLTAKGLLATEQRIPGLGNGVLQDILLNAGVNPRTKVSALSNADKKALFESVKSTLAEMTALGGRDTEKDLFGSSGGYKTKLSAKTAGMICPQCGGPVVKQAYMGGSVYFCPECQKMR
ncbi:MAG: endonuclease VIII, partial [Bacillota bacterium]